MSSESVFSFTTRSAGKGLERWFTDGRWGTVEEIGNTSERTIGNRSVLGRKEIWFCGVY